MINMAASWLTYDFGGCCPVSTGMFFYLATETTFQIIEKLLNTLYAAAFGKVHHKHSLPASPDNHGYYQFWKQVLPKLVIFVTQVGKGGFLSWLISCSLGRMVNLNKGYDWLVSGIRYLPYFSYFRKTSLNV